MAGESLQTRRDWNFQLLPVHFASKILLGFATFAITSPRLLRNLDKAEPLKILNRYIPDLITAWIDEDAQKFKTMFQLTMTAAETYNLCISAFEGKYPSKKKQIRKIASLFMYAIGCAGDMAPDLAESLLDDLSTDGDNIYSDKIADFGFRILKLMDLYGIDIPPSVLNKHNGY